MARWLRQSTSVDVPIGPFLDDTDGKTAETALTLTQPDIRLKKNGGAWAQKAAAQTLSHEENGYYEVTLDATDTATLGLLRLAVVETGALPVWEDFLVVPVNIWDSFFAADLLQVDITQQLGSAPNALVSGRYDASVGAMAANVLTATAINADAITDAKVASDVTIASVTGAVGSVTGAVGSVTGAVGSVGAGGITAASFAANAINAAKLDPDVTTELQAGLATAAALATVDGIVDDILLDTAVIGALGAGLTALATQASVDVIDGIVDAILVDTSTTLQAELDGIQADTEDIQTRLPAALIGGRMNADVQAVNAVEIVGDGDATPWGPA